MFISEKVIFLELHKTGCTHIRNILKKLLGGYFFHQHNNLDSSINTKNKIILGSIRDPWEWYTSLWAYGCDKKGQVYKEVTTKKKLLDLNLGIKTYPLAAFHNFLSRLSKDPQKWQETYSDVNNADNFKKWLYMLNNKSFWYDVGQGYGVSNISHIAGLLTFRYLKLFCCKKETISGLKKILTYEKLLKFENENCFIDYFIRNESLEEDIFKILNLIKINISEKQKKEIMNQPKTNRSSRRFDTSYYYDDKSENLVLSREKLIVEKFGYTPPSQTQKN